MAPTTAITAGGWRLAAFNGPGSAGCNAYSYTPYDLRASMDDDHSLSVHDGAKVTGTLTASARIKIGDPDHDGIDISISVGGGVSAGVEFHKEIRDGVYATRDASHKSAAQSGITIRPRVVSAIDFNPPTLAVNLKVHLDLPIVGKVTIGSFTKNLVPWDHAPTPTHLAQYDTDSDHPFGEETYFRLTTGGANGDVTKQPDARSHLPHAGEFASFPQSIDNCLADNSPNPATPPSAPPVAPGDDPLPTTYNMCLWFAPNAEQLQLPRLAEPMCSSIDSAYPAGNSGYDCFRAYFHFLCIGSHEEDSPPNPFFKAIVRKWDPQDPVQAKGYEDALAACVPAAKRANGSVDETSLTNIASFLTNLAACDANGNLISADDSVSR